MLFDKGVIQVVVFIDFLSEPTIITQVQYQNYFLFEKKIGYRSRLNHEIKMLSRASFKPIQGAYIFGVLVCSFNETMGTSIAKYMPSQVV